MFSLRCDYRENRGGCVIDTLRRLRELGTVVPADKYELREEVMTTGDYAIQFSGYVILIERKTWEDLSASIKDKRIEYNHQKMLAARDLGYRIMYLIEGKAPNPDLATVKVSGIPYGNMMAKLDHFAMGDGILIEYTRDALHTAKRLLEIGKHMLTMKKPAHELKSENGQPVGVSAADQTTAPAQTNPPTALRIDTEDPTPSGGAIRIIENPDEIIKKKYEKSVAETRAAMLACIPGIGPKTAATLIVSHLFSDLVTLVVKPAGLSSFQSSELNALAKGERPTIVVSMLQEIKGVSKVVAQRIAAGFSVEQLCSNNPEITRTISDLKVTEAGRRLGDSLAARIIESWSDASPQKIYSTISNPQDSSNSA